MSAADTLRKLKDQATKALEKKSYAKAAELYQKIAAEEPGEPDWHHRAGEALRKADEPEAAARELVLAAEGYAHGGSLLKAIAVCKVVLQIDPKHTATQAMLARFYAQRDTSGVRTALGVPLTEGVQLARTSSGALAMVPNQAGRAPIPLVPMPAAEPIARAPDPEPEPPSALELDVVSLEEATRGPALAPGAPMEVMPLRAVLGGRKSAQFAAVRPDALEAGAEPQAYEIQLDPIEPELADFELTPRSSPSVASPPRPAPVVVERLDADMDFSELLEPAPVAAPPPPAPSAPPPLLPRIPLFSSLAADKLVQLIERVEVRDLQPGETIVRQGEQGGPLFVVVHGHVQVVLEGPPRREIAALTDGEFFGELALITDFPRSATVIADAPTQLLVLSRVLIAELIADSPEVLRTILRFFRDRLLERLLRSSEIFASFPPDEALTLAQRFVFLELEPKLRVIREGERAPGLFLLLAGEVQVLRGAQQLASLTPGAVFGEMSLLERGKAMASIDTVTKCWALELPREQFQEIMLTYPQVLSYISDLSDRRKQENLAGRVDFL